MFNFWKRRREDVHPARKIISLLPVHRETAEALAKSQEFHFLPLGLTIEIQYNSFWVSPEALLTYIEDSSLLISPLLSPNVHYLFIRRQCEKRKRSIFRMCDCITITNPIESYLSTIGWISMYSGEFIFNIPLECTKTYCPSPKAKGNGHSRQLWFIRG